MNEPFVETAVAVDAPSRSPIPHRLRHIAVPPPADRLALLPRDGGIFRRFAASLALPDCRSHRCRSGVVSPCFPAAEASSTDSLHPWPSRLPRPSVRMGSMFGRLHLRDYNLGLSTGAVFNDGFLQQNHCSQAYRKHLEKIQTRGSGSTLSSQQLDLPMKLGRSSKSIKLQIDIKSQQLQVPSSICSRTGSTVEHLVDQGGVEFISSCKTCGCL